MAASRIHLFTFCRCLRLLPAEGEHAVGGPPAFGILRAEADHPAAFIEQHAGLPQGRKDGLRIPAVAYRCCDTPACRQATIVLHAEAIPAAHLRHEYGQGRIDIAAYSLRPDEDVVRIGHALIRYRIAR